MPILDFGLKHAHEFIDGHDLKSLDTLMIAVSGKPSDSIPRKVGNRSYLWLIAE